MSNYDLEEAKLLKWQIGISIAFIFNLIISISITYNEILKHEKKPPIYNPKTANDIQVLSRTISSLIALAFLYINFIDKNLKKENNININSANLQIEAGTLTLIATIIVLYVSITNNNSFGNPEI